ncbi:MAG: MBL fold metallo-hydrolase [Bacteriovoracaceae bacterium]
MKIQFWGSTDDVTGSMTLLDLPEGKILIDCGLTQGREETVKKNLLVPPFSPSEIEAIVLTHAHLDHCGYIPKLVKDGFRGSIICTPPTMKLAKIIMADSARLQEGREEDKIQNPLYTTIDVTVATSLFQTKEFGHRFKLAGAAVTFRPAGHILGAASVFIEADKTIVFSGDLGRANDPIIPTAMRCPSADAVIMESTYGGKDRTGILENDLHSFLVKIHQEKKVGIVASFAVARAQLLITLIHRFFERHPEYKSRLVIDGPMMKEANKVYKEFAASTNLSEDVFESIDDVDSIDSLGEWDSLKTKNGPLIIISSSGMITGGRIWRHLKNWQNDENALLFLPGYQAEGTAGKRLSEGNREIADSNGERIVWTGEIMHSDAFSSHADQSELLDWVADISKETNIYLLHGEDKSKVDLKNKLKELGHKNIQIPQRGETISLS